MIIGIYGKIRSGKDTSARIIQYLTQRHNEISLEDILNYDPLKNPPTSTWEIKKFAGKLKQCVSLVTGVSLEDLEKQEVKEQNLGPEWSKTVPDPNYPGEMSIVDMTIREMLQQFGTQGGRAIHPDFWVNALFSDYKPTLTGESKQNLLGYLVKPKQYREAPVEYKLPNWIISDVRFPNEVEAIEKNGGIVVKIFRNIIDMDLDRNPAVYDQKQHASETALDNYNFKYQINNNFDIPTLVDNIRNLLYELKLN